MGIHLLGQAGVEQQPDRKDWGFGMSGQSEMAK